MVDAYALLRERWAGNPIPELVVGGDGSERPALEKSARCRGIAQGLHLIGWRDDIHDLHRAFNLFTMSSRSEGTSVSLLEAMSAGLCPVVTDVGGNAAVLGPALHHRLVPSEAPEALAEAWLDALGSPGARGRDADAARLRVHGEFGLERMVREYERVYSGG
jgi:glycosyltransferase involved in cell wall biosynthesis